MYSHNLLDLLPAVAKLLALLAYFGFAVYLVWTAMGRRLPRISFPRALVVLIVCAAISLLWARFTAHGPLFLAAVAAGTALFAYQDDAWKSPQLVAVAAAVTSLAVSLAWWLAEEPNPSVLVRLVAFVLVVAGLQAAFWFKEEAVSRSVTRYLTLVYLIAGLLLLVNLAAYQVGPPLYTFHHHQGAYIGPALHIRAGLVPFYDVPLQYGLGPALAVAGACELGGCWSGMQLLTVAANLAMGLLILRMALSTSTARGLRWTIAATFVVFAAVFFWPAIPNLGNLPAAAPSTGGMRFLPAVLVAFLLFFERPGVAAAVLAPAVLWSPESAYMSMAVFGVHETARLGLRRAMGRAIGIGAGAYIGMAVVHRLTYGVWVQPDVIAEYVLHVPGVLPIEWRSDVLLLIAAFGLAAWTVCRTPVDASSFRRDLVAASLLFGAASYYFGRSHPNNVCNLMPFVALVGFRTLDGQSPIGFPALNRLAVIGLSTTVAAGALSLWQYVPFRNGFMVNPNILAAAAANEDRAMPAIRKRIVNPEYLGIADFGWTFNRNPVETVVWTNMDPLCLWASLPSARRKLYIRRSAARLRLPGWVIIGDAERDLLNTQRDLLNEFSVAYRITDVTTYMVRSPAPGGEPLTYTVAHLIPLDNLQAP
jgi:hypothetical protein